MGAFVSGAQTNPGSSYAPASGTDTALIWVTGAYGVGTATVSSQLFGATSMTEPTAQDQSIDLAGNGDPTGNATYLVNPGTSSAALTNTYSSSRAGSVGYAFTCSGIDQSTPISGTPTGTTYTSATAPTRTYSAVSGDVVVYWRIHATSGSAITWTDPTNFTQRSSIAIITSPARRTIAVWTRDVTSTLSSVTVAATSNETGDGVHGCFVLLGATGGGGGTILPFINKYYMGLR
jgi:hypothetical protein